ncbi:MAG: hypothetical protein RR548_05840 [Carnobacterium sp.]|uniref:hypothetical protein n=1 Tax=unclassified Carnobacterium TaxID=257487 RepID=UPI001912E0EC|nr:hypothetical protein [Carnobacterium sp. CS13]QQP69934.1 hypothetical protein JHE06_10070 [Carnobacterium sp. CS13]
MKIYLVLTDTNTLFSRTIKLYTRAEYNHASLALDPTLKDIYSFGRKRPRNPFNAGFIQEDLSRDYFLRAQCSIHSCDVTAEQFALIADLIQYYEQTKNMYHYNLLGLITLALKIDFKRNDAFFCSQFVATLLDESTIYDFQKEIHFVTPQDLAALPIFRSVYVGSLYGYLASVQESPNELLALTEV